MKIYRAVVIVAVLFWSAVSAASEVRQPVGSECVILLHGLARTSRSMQKMENHLASFGYRVINVDYPSRKFKIETLAEMVIPKALNACNALGAEKVNFVTHSLGGIIVRYFLAHNRISNLGRVVMLSPPNKGSEVVDKLSDFYLFKLINGPSGGQLGTDPESIPSQLGPLDFAVGIITGNRSINPFLSSIIPGADDGKVSVERAKAHGMHDFLVVAHTHSFIMQREDVLQEVVHFLKYGYFVSSSVLRGNLRRAE